VDRYSFIVRDLHSLLLAGLPALRICFPLCPLVNRWQAVSEQPSHIVNRAGKTDRLADIKPFAVPTKTVSLRLNDLADTSVLLRIPSAQARTTKQPTLLRNQSRKPTLACEPVVSALTDVARLLQPGRCVT
jgi:hypothetical protein